MALDGEDKALQVIGRIDLFLKIPYSAEQGIYTDEQGKIIDDQGSYP